MSRIGKAPISVPDKVSVSLNGLAVTVKGPKGELSRTLPEGVSVAQDGNTIVVSPTSSNRRSRERHGLCRTLVANMVEGVSQGFTRKLEIVGVGYRAALQGKKLVVSAGYSHQVEMDPPPASPSPSMATPRCWCLAPTRRSWATKPPRCGPFVPLEPYKGKGIKYEGEKILRKAGKTGKK